jgi:hypothetical protein
MLSSLELLELLFCWLSSDDMILRLRGGAEKMGTLASREKGSEKRRPTATQ